MIKGVPLGRLGRLEDVASAVLFAASSESGFVAGHELFVASGGAAVLPEFILLNECPRSGMRLPTGATVCGRCAPYLW
ncbi:SDR family oxidoreductase [Sphingomonas aerolata]|uniref:SDR family oxidoreductase n=1 Tax=Sphingomonas aerolata TaxID=185951 RepID=UPI003346373D